MDGFTELITAIKANAVQAIGISNEMVWSLASYSGEIFSQKKWHDQLYYCNDANEDIISVLEQKKLSFFNLQKNELKSISLTDIANCFAYGQVKKEQFLFIGKRNGHIDVVNAQTYRFQTIINCFNPIDTIQVLANGLMVSQGNHLLYYQESGLKREYAWDLIRGWDIAQSAYKVFCNQECVYCIEANTVEGVVFYPVTHPAAFTLLSEEKEFGSLKSISFSDAYIVLGFLHKIEIWSFKKRWGFPVKLSLELSELFDEEVEEIISLEKMFKGYVLFKTTSMLVLYNLVKKERAHIYPIEELLFEREESECVGAYQNKVVMLIFSIRYKNVERLLKISYRLQEKHNFTALMQKVKSLFQKNPKEARIREADFQELILALLENGSVKKAAIQDIPLTDAAMDQLNDLQYKRKDIYFSFSAEISERKIEVLHKKIEEMGVEDTKEKHDLSQSKKRLERERHSQSKLYLSRTLSDSAVASPTLIREGPSPEQSPEQSPEKETPSIEEEIEKGYLGLSYYSR